MPDRKQLEIFISSPSDVRPERLVAQRIIERLDREFSYHFRIAPILWEREPLIATEHFQTSITPPHESDIVVVILWSRLGLSLPVEKYPGKITGRPVTGTEWEFEDAVASYRNRRLPDLLLYRKRAQIPAFLDDDALLEHQRQQKRLLEDFVQRWFVDTNAGTFKAASREFTTVAEFEDLLETHLRELLLARLKGQAVQGGIRWPGSPFRGLESFEPEHAQVFFGRTRARNELRELLSRRIAGDCAAFVLVLGASGSGKSSLVKAGLLADLKLPGIIGRVALCRHAVLRPGDAPTDLLGGLAAAILSPTALPELAAPPLSCPRDRLVALLHAAPEQVALPIEQGLAVAGAAAQLTEHAEARLLLVVDQLEELFTLDGVVPEDRPAFVAALEGLARSGLVWIVATMRSDFFDRLETLPALAQLSADARYLLTSPDAVELGQIIRQPAREAGLRFEVDRKAGLGLDDRLLQAAGQAAAALPLLEFTLDQLWQRRNEGGELTFAAYEELGGLEGALGRRAEEEFTNLPPEVQAALPEVLRALATVGQGTRAIVTARPAVLSWFPPNSPGRCLVEAFLSPRARLLVADDDDEGARVRVAHEALLTRWVRARELLARDRADLQVRARLEENGALWHDAPKESRDSLLLRPGLPLAQAQDLLKRRRGALDSTVIAYIEASADAAQAQARRERRRLRTAVAVFAGLTLLAVAGAWFAYLQSQQAERQSRIALTRQMAAQALAELSSNPQRSLLLAVQSIAMTQAENVFNPTEASSLLHHVLAATGGLPLSGDTRPVVATAFSPRGDWLATGSDDGTARLWKPGLPSSPPIVLHGHTAAITALSFSADSRWLVTSSKDSTATLWDLASSGAAHRVTLRGHRGAVNVVAFSPAGRWLATAGDDSTVRLWDLNTVPIIAEPRVLSGRLGGGVTSLVFSAEGGRLAAASFDGRIAVVWNMAADGTVSAPLALPHNDGILAIALSRDGSRLAVANAYSLHLWDLAAADPRVNPVVLPRSTQWVLAVAFSPDGRRLAAGGLNALVRLWDLTAPDFASHPAVLRGHTGSVKTMAFSPDGRWLATAGQDASTRLWDLSDPIFPSIPMCGHEGAINAIAIDPEGHRLATASDDGTTRLWTLPDPSAEPTVLHEPGCAAGARDCATVDVVAFSSDGRWLASAGRAKTIRLWKLAGPFVPGMVLSGHGSDINALAFSPDGHWLAATNLRSSNVVWLWDLTDPAHSASPILLGGHQSAIESMAFSPGGRWFATGSWDRTICVWDLRSRLPGSPRYILSGNRAAVRGLAFSADDKRLASVGGDPSSHEVLGVVWDMTAADPRINPIILRGHRNIVFDVAFSPPDGRWVATASWDKTARLWDMTSANPSANPVVLKFTDRVFSVAFSPDGHRMAAAAWDGLTQLLDVRTPAAGPTLLRGPQGRILSAAFSPPDGRWLAVASEDNSIWLWNPNDLNLEPTVVHGHTGHLAFSPDGRWLATGSPNDAATRVWSFDVRELMSSACRTAGRNLTAEEWRRFLGGQPYHKTSDSLPGQIR
jgi:WD40 repeat protein